MPSRSSTSGGHASAQFERVMLGRNALDEAFDARQRRTPRDDIDEPGRRIGAEQRPLRTAQDLDALDVGEFARRRAVAGQKDAIQEDADRRLLAGVILLRRYPAQHDAPGPRIAILFGGETRRHLRQVVELRDARRGQLIAGERGQRNGNVDQPLLALLSGDDDLRIARIDMTRVARCGGLRADGIRRGDHGKSRRAQENPFSVDICHRFSPQDRSLFERLFSYELSI